MSAREVCAVCGSSAPITRTSRARTLSLCYYHEAVCSAHLKDPCPVCDGGEPDPARAWELDAEAYEDAS